MADLEANMMHLQLLDESIARFNENFASFLYGMNMSAFCVDFSEAPGAESFRRLKDRERHMPAPMPMRGGGGGGGGQDMAGGVGSLIRDRGDVDATFL